MKTLLSQFCDEFELALRPVLEPLTAFVGELGRTGDRAGQELGPLDRARGTLPELQDLSHQLTTLVDKVAEQQAYVLIFGPLKSGKSTLMNAISAAYVSEVTALPAYPCMVYVSHAPSREFVVTRYDGDKQSFGAPASMRMQVNRDHAELAERIRAEEGSSNDFDPATDFPEAIRRIDVRVPATALDESGAVLVDTPGLYAKMKFGYDQMTREFRDAAACAIFVVKTDNLFLEQVFEEFQSLLELFSRIFLVVNIDTSKMDLRPDGSLAPSLERDDPVRVIEAFETLAMSAPLKRAVDEGRLRIYPVDLLRAASSRLQGNVSASSVEEEYAGRADFQSFVGDLTEYLNSSDHLVSFLGDSLRQGRKLLAHADQLTSDEAVEGLARRAAELEDERDELERRREDLEQLQGFDWNEAYASVGPYLVEASEQRAPELWGRAIKRVGGAIDSWFESDESLARLLGDDVTDEIGAFQREYATLSQEALRERAGSQTAGALLPEDMLRTAERAGLRLADFAATGLVAMRTSRAVEPLALELPLDVLPVKRGFFDFILFRSAARLRRQLFGSLQRPTRAIPRGEKAKRLGERGRDWLHTEIHARVDGALQQVTEAIASVLAQDYRDAIVSAIRDELARQIGRAERRRTQVEAELERLRGLSQSLEELRERVTAAAGTVETLGERYGSADGAQLEEVVLQPVAPPAAEPGVEASEPSETLEHSDRD